MLELGSLLSMHKGLGLFGLTIAACLVVLTAIVRRLFLLLPSGGQIHLVVDG